MRECELSRVQLFETQWTIALQAPVSMGFSRQARILKWIATSSSRNLPYAGIETLSTPESPALEGEFFTTWAIWEAYERSR